MTARHEDSTQDKSSSDEETSGTVSETGGRMQPVGIVWQPVWNAAFVVVGELTRKVSNSMKLTDWQ